MICLAKGKVCSCSHSMLRTKWIEPVSNLSRQPSTWLYDVLGRVCGLCMQYMIGSQQHTRSVSIHSLQLALPLMGKYSKYTFVGRVGTCAFSNCLDVLAGITEVYDTTGACVSRVSIQRPLADVERLLVLQRSVKKLPLPCNNRCMSGCARSATHCMDEPNRTSLCLHLYKGSMVWTASCYFNHLLGVSGCLI